MTLFAVQDEPIRRAAKPLPKGSAKPVWTKYVVVAARRCSECEQVSFDALPGPAPAIRHAKLARRQDGTTRLYCNEHGNAQRDEDQRVYGASQ